MRLILLTYIFLLFFGNAFSQVRLPIEEFYTHEIYRHYKSDSANLNLHLAAKPILPSKHQLEKIYVDSSKQYYWITQKLFKENFLIFEGKGFWCAVDPVIDLELGHDFQIDSLHYKFWNTRGIRVQASFLDKLGFVTTFYETQATLVDYQSNFIDSRGEYILTGGLSTYKQVNAIVPGYGRTKNFKTNGYDFAFAQGYFTFAPNKFFTLDFGNGNHFIGHGQRSLLLSDHTTNYTYLKPEFHFWKGKIQYQTIYALLSNPYRLKYFETPEATYERKLGAFHFLDIIINKNWNVGFFEGTIWRHTDSTGTHQPDLNFFNPIIGVNSLLKKNETNNFNSILGVNVGVNFKIGNAYSQAVFDNQTLSAFQAGFLLQDILLKKLDVRLEYNAAKSNTYLTANKRYNYAHNNLSLAHPLGSNFQEMILGISYQYKRFYVQNHLTYSAQYYNDSINIGSSILHSKSNSSSTNFERSKTFYNQFELGYRFNKRYNLQLYLGYLFRQNQFSSIEQKTQYFYFGIRTRLKNKRFDY